MTGDDLAAISGVSGTQGAVNMAHHHSGVQQADGQVWVQGFPSSPAPAGASTSQLSQMSKETVESIFAREEWTSIGQEPLQLELELTRQRTRLIEDSGRREAALGATHDDKGLGAGGDAEAEGWAMTCGDPVDVDIGIEVDLGPGEALPVGRLSHADIGDGEGTQQVVIVSWAEDDPDDPFNWPRSRKYSIVVTAALINMFANANLASPSILVVYGMSRFGVTREEFMVSLTVPLLAYSFTPMLLTPLSEIYGRYWFFQVGSLMTALLFIPQALSRSFPGLLIARCFQGMSSSVSNTLVSGMIAELFQPAERGAFMSFFALLTFVGQALGGMLGGVIGMRCGISWCYAIQGIAGGVSCILNLCFLRETRPDILLARKARMMTRQTGIVHLVVADLEKLNWRTVFTVSIVRPFQYLLTEPIVTALSAWISFACACVYLGGVSVYLVFEQYGFDIAALGLFQTPVFLGALLGFITNLYENKRYRRAAKQTAGYATPEARLRGSAALGGIAFPLAMFSFAWTGQPSVPWPVPALALVIANWGVYCMFTGTFNYLADAYETYSSSAQASQSWARNTLSAVFPLFAKDLYVSLGYPGATTLVASIALVLAAAPILLIRYGKALRAKSKVTSALVGDS